MSVVLLGRCPRCEVEVRQAIGSRHNCVCGARFREPRCRRCEGILSERDLTNTVTILPFDPSTTTMTLTQVPVCDPCYALAELRAEAALVDHQHELALGMDERRGRAFLPPALTAFPALPSEPEPWVRASEPKPDREAEARFGAILARVTVVVGALLLLGVCREAWR